MVKEYLKVEDEKEEGENKMEAINKWEAKLKNNLEALNKREIGLKNKLEASNKMKAGLFSRY